MAEKNTITYADLYEYIVACENIPQEYRDKAQAALDGLNKKNSKPSKSSIEAKNRREAIYEFMRTQSGPLTGEEIAEALGFSKGQVSSAMSVLCGGEGLTAYCVKGEVKVGKSRKVTYAIADEFRLSGVAAEAEAE